MAERPSESQGSSRWYGCSVLHVVFAESVQDFFIIRFFVFSQCLFVCFLIDLLTLTRIQQWHRRSKPNSATSSSMASSSILDKVIDNVTSEHRKKLNSGKNRTCTAARCREMVENYKDKTYIRRQRENVQFNSIFMHKDNQEIAIQGYINSIKRMWKSKSNTGTILGGETLFI